MDQEIFESIIRKYELSKIISEVLWVKCELAVPRGENYLSTVTRVRAGVILGSGVKRTISIVVKTAVVGNATADWSNETGLFTTEITAYSKILFKMYELMNEFGDTRGKLWPDMIAHEPNEIIFEDLKESGFIVADRCKCLDLTHSKLLIRSIARFHAMSTILLKQNKISPSDVPVYSMLGSQDFTNKLWGNGLKILVREMKSWGPEWTDIRERLLKFSDVVAEKLLELYKVDENKFNVINHGDLWICNLMFKYEPYENIPIAVRFVDYQLVHYQSYGWDLTYAMYTSLLGDFRRKYYNELLDIYATTLRESLLLYDYPENEIPTLNDVKQEMEDLQLFAIPICTLNHPVMTMPVENSYSLSEGLNPEKYENYGYNPDVFGGRYKDEIGPDIRRFAENGLF